MDTNRETCTAKQMIDALSLLPPETLLYTEDGFVRVYAPTIEEVSYFSDGTPTVLIN